MYAYLYTVKSIVMYYCLRLYDVNSDVNRMFAKKTLYCPTKKRSKNVQFL